MKTLSVLISLVLLIGADGLASRLRRSGSLPAQNRHAPVGRTIRTGVSANYAGVRPSSDSTSNNLYK